MSEATQVMGRNILPPGHELFWYTIEEVLGSGGFGTTYLATDNNLNRPVAIKEYLPSVFAYREADFTVNPLSSNHDGNYNWGLTSFLNEAKTLAQFKHRNVVQVHTVFEAHNTAYMVMEYEQGDNLEQIFKAGTTPLDQPFFEKLLFLVMDGLQSIHDAGFIHRDIKPGNLYIRKDGSPVLIDFGSARATSQQENSEMTTLVSQGYTPIEQYSSSYGEQGPWTDIYSLAACVYRGLTGKRPDDALSRGAARSTARDDTIVKLAETRPAGFDASFCHAIDCALSLEADRRPQSLQEWRAIFDRPVGDDDETTRIWRPNDQAESDAYDAPPAPDRRPDPSHTDRRGSTPYKSNAPLIGGGVVLALVLAGGGWWFATQGTDTTRAIVTAESTQSLPRPAEPMDIVFPDDEVAAEIADLRDLNLIYQELLDADPNSGQAAEGIAFVVNSYAALSELNVIKSNPSLRKKLTDALGKITVDANGDVESLIGKIRSYEQSTFGDISPLLDKPSLSDADRERLIYGLASLPTAESQQAAGDSRVAALLQQFKRAIVVEIENEEFERASHMLALALSVAPNDRELTLLQDHLTHQTADS